MKNLVFSLIAIVLFSINGNAQESSQTEKTTFKEAELKTSFNGEDVVYKFNSEKDFEEGSDKIITDLVSKSGGSSNTDQPCMVTISMTVTVTIEASAGVVGGSTTVTVTGSVTTSCENAVAAGKKLRKQLIAMAQG